MKNQVLLLNTGYSLRGLMQSNPNVAAQFALLGIDFDEERQVSSRQQLIEQVSRSVQDCQLLLLLDHDPQLRAREILAQGFRKPLHRDEQAAQQLASRGQAETAMIPQDAIALTDPGCSQAGFVLFFPSVCVALIPGSAAEALRMIANQLFPMLLTHSFPGAVTVDVPLRSDRIEEVRDYLERVRHRNRAFLPLLGGTTSSPVLRLIAAQDSQKRSRQCCDSFLEDLVSECGNVTTVSRVGVRGICALERKKQPSQAEFLNRASAPPRTNTADLYAAPPRTNTADPYAALSEQLYEPDDLYDDDEDEEEQIRKISDLEYIVEGTLSLDDLNDYLDLEEKGLLLESEDFDSVGGIVIELLDRLPEVGDEVTTENGIRLVVDSVEKNRIKNVHIYLPDPPAAEDTKEE